MNKSLHPSRSRIPGFTLIELMVVLALMGTLVAMAVPSFNRFMAAQRLRGVNSMLVTDLQLARSEAAARNKDVIFTLYTTNRNAFSSSCYVIFIGTSPGDCRCDTNNEKSNCAAAGAVEIRTVKIERKLAVDLRFPRGQALGDSVLFDAVTGRIKTNPADEFETPDQPFVIEALNAKAGTLRNSLEVTGRPSVCSPAGAVSGVTPCP